MNEHYVDALKALAEPHRLRLFWLLIHVNQCITVAEAMDVTGHTQYNASRNLKILHRVKLVSQDRRGKWVYYTLAPQTQPHWMALIESVRALPMDEFSEVMARCQARLAMRQNNECVIGPNSEDWLNKRPH